MAAALKVHTLGASLVASSTAIMKFVDYPVVERTPARTDVL
jgi:hypothetical protein